MERSATNGSGSRTRSNGEPTEMPRSLGTMEDAQASFQIFRVSAAARLDDLLPTLPPAHHPPCRGGFRRPDGVDLGLDHRQPERRARRPQFYLRKIQETSSPDRRQCVLSSDDICHARFADPLGGGWVWPLPRDRDQQSSFIGGNRHLSSSKRRRTFRGSPDPVASISPGITICAGGQPPPLSGALTPELPDFATAQQVADAVQWARSGRNLCCAREEPACGARG